MNWRHKSPPLLPVAILSLLGVILSEASWWGIPVFILIGVWAFIRQKKYWLYGLVAGLLLLSLHAWRLEQQQYARGLLSKAGEMVEFKGVVARTEGVGSNSIVVRVKELTLPLLGSHRVRSSILARGIEGTLLPGDVVCLRGNLAEESGPRNPGELDRLANLLGNGYAGMVWTQELEKQGGWAKKMALWRGSEVLRKAILQRMGGTQEVGKGTRLLQALVLGERYGGDLGNKDFEPFRLSGTMHIFAVSGLHVGMVGLLAWWLVGMLRVQRLSWTGFLLVVGAMAIYAFATGLRPPAMRALLMAVIYLYGGLLRRRPWGLNALFAALPVVLLFNSFSYKQPGFQLSFLIVGVMSLFVPVVWRRMSPCFSLDDYLPRQLYSSFQEFSVNAGRWVGGLAAVSFVAWLGSSPLVAWHFHLFTPVAVLGGILLVPMAFTMLSLAFVGLVMSVVWQPAGERILEVDKWVALKASSLAEGLSNLPGSHYVVSRGLPWKDGILVMSGESSGGAVHLDVGGGVLIDGGGRKDFLGRYNTMRQRLGLQADTYLISHGDSAHVGGLVEWAKRDLPKQVVIPRDGEKSRALRGVLSWAKEAKSSILYAHSGDVYLLGEGISLTVLHDGRGSPSSSAADDMCMVLRLDWKGWRFLFTSDVGLETERLLLEHGVDLNCDVWVAGHHYGDLTGSPDFVHAVSPKVVIISDGGYEGYAFSPQWKGWIKEMGIYLFEEKATGAIAIAPKSKKLEISPFLVPNAKVILERE